MTVFLNTDKQSVKGLVIVRHIKGIYIEDFLTKANSNIKVIGVIDAGAS